MAGRIGVLEPDQAISEEPRSFVKKVVAAYLVRKAMAVRIPGRAVIQRLEGIAEATYRELKKQAQGFYNGPLGTGNAIPFSRRSDGSPLHYDIPPAGCIGLWRHFRKRIRVSARPQSHLFAHSAHASV